MDAKISELKFEKKLHTVNISPPRYLLITKRKDNNFTLEKTQQILL